MSKPQILSSTVQLPAGAPRQIPTTALVILESTARSAITESDVNADDLPRVFATHSLYPMVEQTVRARVKTFDATMLGNLSICAIGKKEARAMQRTPLYAAHPGNEWICSISVGGRTMLEDLVVAIVVCRMTDLLFGGPQFPPEPGGEVIS